MSYFSVSASFLTSSISRIVFPPSPSRSAPQRLIVGVLQLEEIDAQASGILLSGEELRESLLPLLGPLGQNLKGGGGGRDRDEDVDPLAELRLGVRPLPAQRGGGGLAAPLRLHQVAPQLEALGLAPRVHPGPSGAGSPRLVQPLADLPQLPGEVAALPLRLRPGGSLGLHLLPQLSDMRLKETHAVTGPIDDARLL
ncbi:hypothetical protein EYF80_036928 [Liparis tanakae]|uniref:Uncharacterized protein n=1 Tax=Liparis tanakae TaxID=230148 RepID=A0A4Z2GH10_9TELE|nr:hypothetical protein EYF80_036928 [Liparis tanakae]